MKSASLPAGRSSASGVWISDAAYLFGGFHGALANDVLRYEPTLDKFTTMQATLPTARSATSAAADGLYAYVFGGIDGLLLRQIVRYDPQTDATAVMNALLPTGRSETAAVWADGVAYVVGGFDGTLLDQIVRYDPSGNEVAVMGGKLPTGRSGPAAVWTGQHVLVFGGSQDGSQILRYDPVTDTVVVMTAKLPSSRYRASATWDGHFAYVFGGNDGSALNQIVRYDPKEDVATTLGITLPRGRSESAAAIAGYTSYVFGGCCDGASLLQDVVGLTSANVVPWAEFEVGRSGLSVAVDAAASMDSDGSLVQYAWDWGDGTSPGAGVKTTHTYAAAGTNTIRLTVEDNRGLKAEAKIDVPLTAPSPGGAIASFVPLPRPTGAAPAPSDAAPDPSADPQTPEEGESEYGEDGAGGRAAAPARARGLSGLVEALSDSWSAAPGLWVGLALVVGTGCAIGAVFLFRMSATGRSRVRITRRPPRS